MTSSRGFGLRVASVVLVWIGVGLGCSGAAHPSADAGTQTWTHPDGNVSVDVSSHPFGLVVRDAGGNVLMESAPAYADAADASDPLDAYAPLSFTNEQDESTEAVVTGWDNYRGQVGPWQQATVVTEMDTSGVAWTLHLAANDGVHTLTLVIEPNGPGVRLLATVDNPGTDPDTQINRASLGWKMHDDVAAGAPGDHFLGLGERYSLADHRGASPRRTSGSRTRDSAKARPPPGPANPGPTGRR